MEEEGLPDVRCARTLEEAVAMPTDGRTITVIVAAALGKMPYITPGAYADHIDPTQISNNAGWTWCAK
jgi:hypothetical protein